MKQETVLLDSYSAFHLEREEHFLWPPAVSPSPVWAEDATSVLCCRMHIHLPGEATRAPGSHTAAVTLANPILCCTTEPLQEVQSQPMESTTASYTILQHKAICFCIHTYKDCPMKANVIKKLKTLSI